MRAFYIILAGWLAGFWLLAAHAEKPEQFLTIAADEWCPINCTPGALLEGVGIDVARAVFEPMGYRIRYVTMPWARALEEVRAGRIDAVVGANDTDDATLIFPRTPISEIRDCFYARKSWAIPFKNATALKAYRLGVIKSYGYDESIVRFLDAQRAQPGMVQEVSGDDALEQNIRKLLAGRVDVVIESGVVMRYMLHKLQLEDQIIEIGNIPQGYVYLGFSPALPRSQVLVKAYDSGVAQLKASGALGTFYAPYNLTSPGGDGG